MWIYPSHALKGMGGGQFGNSGNASRLAYIKNYPIHPTTKVVGFLGKDRKVGA
jgi:hypothetical protein